jgi:glutamine amidotransferase
VITIVDYKAGNLTSVQLAFAALGVPVEITDRPDRLLAASRVVFPGVGAAGSAMATLHALGLADPIRTVVQRGTPFLGICIGMQLLFDRSEEDGGTPCLGLVPGTVRRFPARVAPPAGGVLPEGGGPAADSPIEKIPQMGWNTVAQAAPHLLWDGIEDESEFYFVHSYYPAPDEAALAATGGAVAGRGAYAGVTFASAVARANLFATQFHPEKSGRIGLRLLENFTRWNPPC